MVIIVKSAPHTTEGKRGISLARELRADLVLMQDAVYALRSLVFEGPVHYLDEDCRMRGLGEAEIKRSAERLSYEGLVDLMASHDAVIGAF